MARKITFTKAEREAIAGLVHFDGDLTGLQAKALKSLLAKMDACEQPPASSAVAVTAGQFVDEMEKVLGDRFVRPQNARGWAMLQTAVNDTPIFKTPHDVEELAMAMDKWVKGAISAQVVASKGGEWLAKDRANGALGRHQSTSSSTPITPGRALSLAEQLAGVTRVKK